MTQDDKSLAPEADLALIFAHNKDGWVVAIPLQQERIVDFGESAVSPVIYRDLATAMAAAIVYLESEGLHVY